MATESLEAEVERLRAEVESYRKNELDELRNQLAAAREAAEHYRSEALRNAQIARDLDANAQEHILRLQAELETTRRTKLKAVRGGVSAIRR